MTAEGQPIDVACPHGCESTVSVTSMMSEPPTPITLTCEACGATIERCSRCEEWTSREKGRFEPFGTTSSISEELVCPEC